jgi:hypothetical protein
MFTSQATQPETADANEAPPGACSGPLPPADGVHSPARPSASAVGVEESAGGDADADPLGSADFASPLAFQADIPIDLARRAHAGTSFSPERRGEQERDAYATTLAGDWATLSKFATTDDRRAILAVEFPRFREGFRRRYVLMLAAKGACISTMIAGPSNFNTRRAQKRSDSADRRQVELLEFRERALKAIIKALCPEGGPIMLGDSDASQRIREKLAAGESKQGRMKAVNAAIRKHAKAGPAAQIAALVELRFSETTAAKLLEPDELGRVGFPSYMLTNNGAEIRRLQARLEAVERNQTTPTVEITGEHARFEDNAAENRVRLFFAGKPAVDVRDRLKAAGFRWAPTLGCWQAYRNHNAITLAKGLAG